MAGMPDPHDNPTLLVHATCVAAGSRAVLIVGPSGSGKSDLALRCITTPFLVAGRNHSMALVGDDQIRLQRSGDELIASSPESIAGRMEVRGVGIVDVPFVGSAKLHLVADIGPGPRQERFPSPTPHTSYLGLQVPVMRLAPFEASAPHKLLLALVHGLATGLEEEG